jgi:Ca2+-binding RTX toxin-like protein
MLWVSATVGSIALVGAFASSALAATVRVEGESEGQLYYQADTGETNHVVLTPGHIYDAGATITPVPALSDGITRCVSVNAHEVACDYDGMVVEVADGDDFVSLEGLGADTCCQEHGVFGGDGDDVLIGSASGSEGLHGGPGADIIWGRGSWPELPGFDPCALCGPDYLYGDGGDDVVHSGRHSGVLYGGDGNDLLDGRRGRDWLSGEGGNDRLDGGRGPDTLAAGPGADTLVGGRGHDKQYGDSGRDTLYARDGRWDLVRGGPGSDRARIDPGLDRIRLVEIFF